MRDSTQGGGSDAAASELATLLLGQDPDRGSAQGSTHGSPLPPAGGPGPTARARLAGALAAVKPCAGRAASPGQGGTPASASDSGSFCSAWDSAPEGLGRVSPAEGLGRVSPAGSPALVSSVARDVTRPPAGPAPAEVAALRARVAQLEAQLAAAGLPVAPAATSTTDTPAPRLPPGEADVRPSSLSG